MKIKIWHCYWYGPVNTYVLLAETEKRLEDKVRALIADGWYPDDDGPMPDYFDELLERYQDVSGDTCYFGDRNFSVIDTTLCAVMQKEGDQ